MEQIFVTVDDEGPQPLTRWAKDTEPGLYVLIPHKLPPIPVGYRLATKEDLKPRFPKWTVFRSHTFIIVRRWEGEAENVVLWPEAYNYDLYHNTYSQYIILPEVSEITEAEAKRLVAEAKSQTSIEDMESTPKMRCVSCGGNGTIWPTVDGPKLKCWVCKGTGFLNEHYEDNELDFPKEKTTPICVCGKYTSFEKKHIEDIEYWHCECKCGRSGAWCDTKDAAVLTFPAKQGGKG